MIRKKGLHAVGSTSRQKAIRNLDDAVSKMVRIRDEVLHCILWKYNDCDDEKMECGHFMPRQYEATRFHPCNVNAESSTCNSSHVSGYQPDKGFPYGLAIDEKYGKGMSLLLYRLAKPLHEKDKKPANDNWTETELETLKFAARKGARIYEQIYYELRPTHKPSKLTSSRHQK